MNRYKKHNIKNLSTEAYITEKVIKGWDDAGKGSGFINLPRSLRGQRFVVMLVPYENKADVIQSTDKRLRIFKDKKDGEANKEEVKTT